jgi:adenylate cyclase
LQTARRLPRIQLRIGIAVVFLCVMLPLTGMMTALLYRQNSLLAHNLAESAMESTTRDVVVGVRNLLGPMARVVSLSVAFGKAEQEKLRRFESLHPLVDTLDAFPDLYALYFGFAKDGAFYEVIRLPAPGEPGLVDRHPPAGARYALRIIDTIADEAVDSYIYIGKWGDVQGVERAPVTYDPRPRPWYTAAQQTKEVTTSGVHVFTSIGRPGVTLSQQLATEEGETLGVFGADLLTDTLAKFLAERAIGRDGVVFIMDEEGRMLGYPKPELALTQRGGTVDIVKAEEIGDKVVADAVRLRGNGAGDHFTASLGEHDTSYLVSFSPFPEDFGKHWTIGVIAAESEFVGPLRRASAIILLIGAVFLGLASIAVVEIHTLATAVGAMKTALRSFATYVPKDLVHHIVASGTATEIGGDRRQLTVLFTDLAGFSQACEFLAPEDVATRLSAYFKEMADAIVGHQGTIDKFIGDAIMALWNAPRRDGDHIANACRAVLACRAVSVRQGGEFTAHRLAPMPTRFGLHTGSAVVGNVGSSDRMQYTALGPVVNLASRIENLNKAFGTTTLVSGAVEEAVRDRFLFRPMGLVVPSGLTQPVALFELVAAREPGSPFAATSHELALCDSWARAFALFAARDWAAAAEAFRALDPTLPAAQVLLATCTAYAAAPPPADWDGALRFEGK